MGEPRVGDYLGYVKTQVNGQRLPLNGQHPMALKIAKGSIVAHDLEAVVGPLERTAGSVASISSRTDVVREHVGALGVAHYLDALFGLIVGHRGVSEDNGFQYSALTLGVEVNEPHVLPYLGDCVVGMKVVQDLSRRAARVAEI